jgi:hypothetical protein
VEAVENLGGLLGPVRVLDMISPREDPTSLLGAAPRFGKPTSTLNSNKAAIVLPSKAMVADMAALRLGMAVALHSTVHKEVIHKPLATLSNQHRTTIMLSTIKANTPSNSRSALLPLNASSSHAVNSPLKNLCRSHFLQWQQAQLSACLDFGLSYFND